MDIITQYEAITKVNLPDQPFPVLIPVNEDQMGHRRKGGIADPVDGFFYEDVAQPVSVRCVTESVYTLTLPKNRLLFEAKYGLGVQEAYLKNAFFALMLAEASAGRDPDRGVRQALQYYRGPRPDGLFREGSPVSRGIQQEPFQAVLEMLNSGLRNARLIVWWSFAKRRASLGLYCPDAYSVVFALALSKMGFPGGLGVCQRCGNAFHRSRGTQRYCSHRCQLAASMQRFRKRHAKRHKKKSRTDRKVKPSKSTRRSKR